MVVSLKTDLRFPIPGQQGYGDRIIQIIIEAGLNAQKQFAQNVLRGLTEEEIRLCIRVFDKICNNAEEQLKNDKENES